MSNEKAVTVDRRSGALSMIVLIAGLVLRCTHGWFSQQHTVGDVLLWVSAAPLLVFLGILALAAIVGIMVWAVEKPARRRRRRR